MLLTTLRAGIERGEVRADTNLDVISEMMLGSIFAHYNVLGRLLDEAWMADVVETIWRAIAAP
jgi:hypothetical protein